MFGSSWAQLVSSCPGGDWSCTGLVCKHIWRRMQKTQRRKRTFAGCGDLALLGEPAHLDLEVGDDQTLEERY